MKRLQAAVILFATVLAAGCSNSVDNGPDVTATNPTSGNLNPAGGSTPPPAPTATEALFQPLQGVLPYPTDLYFSGTTDGTLNQPANALVPQLASVNATDGYSTTAPIRARFGGPIDPASLTAANVRVYQVNIDNATKATVGFVRALTLGTDFAVGVASDGGVGNTIVEITPLVPLVPSTGATNNGYLVLLTNGIRTATGAAATADNDYAAMKAAAPTCTAITNPTLNGICRLVGANLQIAQATGVNPANVVLSFSFTTASTRDTLNILAQQIFNPAAPVPAIGVSPTVSIPINQLVSALPPIANARVGTLTVPYYSPIPANANDAGVLARNWVAAAAPPAPLTDPTNERNLTRFNPVPAKQADKAIPLFVTVPNANAGAAGTKPPAGWPVVIFQHGLGGDRTQAVAIAAAFAQAGWVVAAVDAPYHGLTSTTNPLYQAANEQTFNLDLVNNTTGATGPDSVIDNSGTHVINLPNPRASRDTLRQGVVNLLALTRALPNLDLDANPATPDIDGTRMAYVGISLGGLLGATYGAVLPGAPARVPTLVLSVPGGGVAALLRDSPTFSPAINAGLAAQGLTPGTTLYAQFFRDVQGVIDSGDPLNYISGTTAARRVYMSQVIGGFAPVWVSDRVIPNSATQRLYRAGGLNRVVPGAPVTGSGYVNFTAGTHGSLLTPGTTPTELAVLTEMQRQAATYTATGGTIVITDATYIQP
jgi:alpha-beta hydrolase superfamily lysophospholipase